jgi:hypothetical protein
MLVHYYMCILYMYIITSCRLSGLYLIVSSLLCVPVESCDLPGHQLSQLQNAVQLPYPS